MNKTGVGVKIGRWELLSGAKYHHGKISFWNCRCSCGTERVVANSILRRGNSNSCGCLRREYMASGTNQRLHDAAQTVEYRIWADMKQRCLNPKNKRFCRYGKRGIVVHHPWMECFELFLSHVGSRPSAKHSIERINNNGNYEPGNVKWATSKEQGRNRNSNLIITYNGLSLCLTAWAQRLGFTYGKLSSRIRRGWSVERAFTE